MIRTIDLFSGAGGLSLGLKQAGFKAEAAIEIDRFAVATYARHSPDVELISSDVRRVNFRSFLNRVDVVVGGPPCQPFSSGGRRASRSDARDMIPEYLRALSEIRPIAFLMENVPGLAVGDRRHYLNEVIEAMRRLGYVVATRVLKAEEYGVPQKRRRLFVVGMLEGEFTFPDPTHGPGCGQPFVTVSDALPKHPVGELNAAKVTYARNPDLRPSPFDGLLVNGGGRPIDVSKPSHTILASAGGNKTHFFDPNGVLIEYHRYLQSGGSPRSGEVPGARRLTVTESALLQTFPRQVRFIGPKSAQYRLVGNAVPPKLGAVIGQHLARQLGHAPRQHRMRAVAAQQDGLFS